MGGYLSSEAPGASAQATAPVAASEEKEDEGLLSLRQRLVSEDQRPWPERKPLRPDVDDGGFPVGRVPKEVWDLVLCFLTSAEDATAFGRACSLFSHVLRVSRVWPRLLDGRYGQGMSAVLAQSRAVLEAVQEHRRVETAELVAARETFYRRARLEMVRLHFLRQFGELREYPDIPECPKGDGIMYWSAAVFRLPEDPAAVLAVVVTAAYGQEKLIKWLRLKPVFWKGFPVVPFDVFRERCVNITVRLFGGRSGSVVLCATVRSEQEANGEENAN